jgi:hypothetical protein
MTQPPIPPPDGSEPGEQAGSPGWNPPGADDPTRKLRAPGAEGQRDPTRQFDRPQGSPSGQTAYGQPPYGQPPYGQPQYGQPQSGQLPYPEYGQAPTGEPHLGQPPPYGQPPYGPPQYGQSSYGPQAWGPPGGQPPKKNTNTAIVLVVGAVLFLVVIAGGLFFLMRAGDPGGGAASSDSSSEGAPSGSEHIPPATVTPDGLGNDPELDQLAQDCYDGEMQACDDLYQVAELDPLYRIYGGTCAGRQDISDADTIFCTSAFPED